MNNAEIARKEENPYPEGESSRWEHFEAMHCPAGTKLFGIGVSLVTREAHYACYSSEDCYKFLYDQCESNKDLKLAKADCGSLDCDVRSIFSTLPEAIQETLYSKIMEVPIIGDIVGGIFNKVDCPEGMIAKYLSSTKVHCTYSDQIIELQLPALQEELEMKKGFISREYFISELLADDSYRVRITKSNDFINEDMSQEIDCPIGWKPNYDKEETKISLICIAPAHAKVCHTMLNDICDGKKFAQSLKNKLEAVELECTLTHKYATHEKCETIINCVTGQTFDKNSEEANVLMTEQVICGSNIRGHIEQEGL